MVYVITHTPAPTIREMVRAAIIMGTCMYMGWKGTKLTMGEMDTFKGKTRTFGEWNNPQGMTTIVSHERKYFTPK